MIRCKILDSCILSLVRGKAEHPVRVVIWVDDNLSCWWWGIWGIAEGNVYRRIADEISWRNLYQKGFLQLWLRVLRRKNNSTQWLYVHGIGPSVVIHAVINGISRLHPQPVRPLIFPPTSAHQLGPQYWQCHQSLVLPWLAAQQERCYPKQLGIQLEWPLQRSRQGKD